MEKQRRKRKPNKQQREARRQHDADLFNKAFNMGYEVGFGEGVKAAAAEWKSELNKRANFGR